MEQADSCRRAASEAIADVEPAALHDRIEALLADASMVPGVLTLESAAATRADERSVFDGKNVQQTKPNGDGSHHGFADLEAEAGSGSESDTDLDTDAIATQAAGVQLIYEGLRLTRSLAHEEPWTTVEDGEDADGDLEILAADILVARGFYLLARTDAAGKAVRTVQAFGRDQTHRDAVAEGNATGDSGAMTGGASDDPTAIDANLERDILELAVLTGAAAVGDTPSQRLLATAAGIADRAGTSFPPVAECLADLEAVRSEGALEEREHEHDLDAATDRATSATDP